MLENIVVRHKTTGVH